MGLIGAIEQPAHGFSLWDADNNLANLGVAPNSYYSYDPGVITWKFDADANAFLADPLLREQIRLAFKEWEIQRTRNIPGRFHFRRSGDGAPPLADLRTTALHELGHALGSQHPDAAWYNGTPQYMQNFRPDGNGGIVAAPPVGPEVMNEGWYPVYGLRDGEYNRWLTTDEHDLVDYAYSGGFEFVEVGTNEPAMITVTAYSNPTNSNLGQGGGHSTELRTGDPADGWRVLSSMFTVNAGKLGVLASKTSWTVTNSTGEPVTDFIVRTQGTDQFPLDNYNAGAHRFAGLSNLSTASATDPEDRGWRFINPVGGEIPPGESVTAGLELDVWDWSVNYAALKQADGDVVPVNLVTVFPWYNPVLPSPGSSPTPELEESGLVSAGTPGVNAVGFRIVNGGDTPTRLRDIQIGTFGRRNPALRRVNGSTLAELDDAVSVLDSARSLAPGESLIVVTDHDRGTLPRELARRTDVLAVGLGEMGRESLFAAVTSDDGRFTVDTYSIPGEATYDTEPFQCRYNPSAATCCSRADRTFDGTGRIDSLRHRNGADDNACVVTQGGDDVVVLNGGEEVLTHLGEGDDMAVATGLHNEMIGADGEDTIVVAGHTSTVEGGPGDDFIRAYANESTVDAGAGDDLVLCGSGNDTITPGSGRNTVLAGAGNDLVRLRNTCELGPMQLDGGDGTDTLILPISRARAEAAGVVIVGFENVVENDDNEAEDSDCAGGIQ